jgi:hypothetical protein
MENMQKKLSEIGHKSRKQIEFKYDTWKLRTKKIKIDFFDRESIYSQTFSTMHKICFGLLLSIEKQVEN